MPAKLSSEARTSRGHGPSRPSARATRAADAPAADAPAGAARVPRSRYTAFAAIALSGAAVDLGTKHAVFAWRDYPRRGGDGPWWLIENHVGVETAVNIGAVFGIGAGMGLLFAALSVLAAIGILIWLFVFRAAQSWWLTVALGCVMGGILGNLYDRLGMWYEPWMHESWRSGVRDWILIQANDRWKWPNFNIADSLLVTGAIMLVWHSFFPGPPPERDDHEAAGAG